MADDEAISGETCPACGKQTLILMEKDMEIPYFGKAYIFSMDCSDAECGYHIADVELEENKGPVKLEFEIEKEDDMKIRVVKSAAATVKIPRVTTIEPGSASSGYITNIEGILSRVKRIIEKTRDDSEDKSDAKKCKTLLKKLQSVMWGQEKLKIIIEDPTGNSAIISERTIVK